MMRRMLDYASWPSKSLFVTSLLLDQQNPRLPSQGGALGQRQIIDELVTHDAVYELAKDITTQGFFPTEILLGVRDGDLVVIIEGNRRLAALKLLVNPELAPQDYLEKFRRLSEKATTTVLAKVHVCLAPSREAATPILLSRHTAQQIQSWKRPMQARFYRQLLERGLTPDDLVQSYGVTVGQIQDWIRADAVYRLACSLDFPEDVKAKVQNNREFPLSTLERLVESQPIREFLMLKPDPKEVLISSAKPAAFLKAFRRVVADVATSKVDSRMANNADQITEYVKKLTDIKPTARSTGKFSIRDHLSQTDKPVPVVNTKAISRKKATMSASAIPRGLQCFCPDPRVNDIFYELRKLRLDKNPNASAVLLRLLLEFSISFYLDTTSHIKPLLDRLRERDKRRADWYPSLRQLMEHLLTIDVGLQPLELKALKKFIQTKGQNNTLDALDSFVHNRKVEPTETETRAIVRLIEPILQITLGRTEPPTQ
jgi:hypothetical protein